MNMNSTPHIAAQARIATPMGDMTVAVTPRGVAGLWFDHQLHHPGDLSASINNNHAQINAVRRWLDAYWRDAPCADAADRALKLPSLDAAGTEFQQAVWRALCTIAPGTTSTYGAVAAAIGRPDASRAVGAAIGRNPIGIIVPCHRVIGKDGSLTGYAGGLDRKRRLLAHEAATMATGLLV